jgi:hypothetical protein
MSLQKGITNITNEQALTAQDVTDINNTLGVLTKGGYSGTAQDLKDLIDTKQQSPIVVDTATLTAENDKIYHSTVNTTITDPTGVEGKGYVVKVLAGVANVGGVNYVEGDVINRVFESGVWKSIVYNNAVNTNNELNNAVDSLTSYANIEQTDTIDVTVLQVNFGEYIDIDFVLLPNTSYTFQGVRVNFGTNQSFYGKNEDGTYDLLLSGRDFQLQGLIKISKYYPKCAIFVDETVSATEINFNIKSFNELNDLVDRLRLNSTNLAGNPVPNKRLFNGVLSDDVVYKTYLWVYVGGLDEVFIKQASIGSSQFYAYTEKGVNFSVGQLTPEELQSNKTGYYGKITIPSGVKYLSFSTTTFTDAHLYSQPLDQEIPYGVNLNNLINDKVRKLLIPFWGDSLTAGSGSSIIPTGADPSLQGTTTYERVRDLIDSDIYETKENGVGGENALEISARIGANPYMLDSETVLPADTTPVAVNLVSSYDPLATVNVDLDNPSDEINPVIIQGIECEITEDAGGNNFINRVTASSSSDTLVENAFVIPRDSYSYLNPYCAVFWMGTNGVTNDFARFYRNIINYVNPNSFIVVGLYNNESTSPGVAEDAEMIKEFGGNYVELRNYLCKQGINDAIKKGYLPDDGTYPTSADLLDIAAGIVPNSLRADGVHLNAVGQVLVGDAIYKRMIDLGIFYNK